MFFLIILNFLQDNTQTSETNSNHLKLSVKNEGDKDVFVKFQVFLSRHLVLLTSLTKQRPQNSRSKRNVDEDIEHFISAYNGC